MIMRFAQINVQNTVVIIEWWAKAEFIKRILMQIGFPIHFLPNLLNYNNNNNPHRIKCSFVVFLITDRSHRLSVNLVNEEAIYSSPFLFVYLSEAGYKYYDETLRGTFGHYCEWFMDVMNEVQKLLLALKMTGSTCQERFLRLNLF